MNQNVAGISYLKWRRAGGQAGDWRKVQLQRHHSRRR